MSKATNTLQARRRKLYSLLALLEMSDQKGEIVAMYANGDESTSALSDAGWDALFTALDSNIADHLTATRNKIIYFCRELGMELPDGKGDYERIDAFIQGVGSRNPRKVKLFQLRSSELNVVCSQIEMIYRKEVGKRSACAKTSPAK